MSGAVLKAGVLSIGSLITSQLIRFAGNLILAKLLAPAAFGLVGIVNMVLLGINLFSDIGLRQLVIQRQGNLADDFLNAVWTMQILRGFFILFVALMIALGLGGLQHFELLQTNVYADSMLPYLIVGASTSAVISGFESTKAIMMRRDLHLGRLTILSLSAQLIALLVMVVIAASTSSPWALVAGAIVMALVQSGMSRLLVSGVDNRINLDWVVIGDVFKKGRWILLSSPLTFLGSNAEVMILGALVTPDLLGNYMIAYLLANVIHQVATNLSGNVFFPALSAAARQNTAMLKRVYVKFQMVSDAIILPAAGILMAAGPSIVNFLFDTRYSNAGSVLSALAIGLVGVRYHVIEQLVNSQGGFKIGTINTAVRLVCVVVGTFTGYHYSGLTGAALGAGLSWFGGWPVLLWSRAKLFNVPWFLECFPILCLAVGYGMGLIVVNVLNLFQGH